MDVLKEFPDNYFSSCITDPPYELGFMGKKWDQSGIAYSQELWSNVLRVLKPGAYLLSFGGTRTYHRMACAIEDAGFEIRDCIDWVYGSGFPKSLDISKKLDQMAGAEREVISLKANPRYLSPRNVAVFSVERRGYDDGTTAGIGNIDSPSSYITAPTTPAAKQWAGWGSALKPAHEPIVLARKPLEEKTIAANVLRWGTGGLNIDKCRIPANDFDPKERLGATKLMEERPWNRDQLQGERKTIIEGNLLGRFPANLILSYPEDRYDDQGRLLPNPGKDAVLAGFPDRKSSHGGGHSNGSRGSVSGMGYHGSAVGFDGSYNQYYDSGSTARFFMACPWSEEDYIMPFIYTSKASSSERNGCRHPNIKPLKLIKYLVTLITPPGGIVLDPFLGSGTTGIACNDLGFDWIGIDLNVSFATERLTQNKKELSKEKNIMEWK